MTLLIKEEMERRNLVYLAPFVNDQCAVQEVLGYSLQPVINSFMNNKRAGARSTCSLIIEYLLANFNLKNLGWVMSIELWEMQKKQKINPKTFSIQLIDLENSHIIDKISYLSPPIRRRPGSEKKRENVFYRLSLGHALIHQWTREELEEQYIHLYKSYEEVSEKWNIALELLQDLKKINQDIFKELKMTECNPEEIINCLYRKSLENQNQASERKFLRIYQSTDDVLKSILDSRCKIITERHVGRQSEKDEKEVIEAKNREDFHINRKKQFNKEHLKKVC